MTRVLAIDPSSTCTGWAVLDGLAARQLVQGGLITPDRKAPAPRRIEQILGDLDPLITEFHPDRMVVEVPSGKAGTGSRQGAKSSLTIYGMAAGAVWGWCLGRFPGRVIDVNERAWTAGAGSKQERALGVAALYRHQYKIDSDPKLDLADAIGLGRWYLQQDLKPE